MSELPTTREALERIWALAEAEEVELSRRAARQSDNLGYTHEVVCDMLYELQETDLESLDWSHWEPNVAVGTFRAVFTRSDIDDAVTDELFVEIAIRPDSLYVLACKLYGSPE